MLSRRDLVGKLAVGAAGVAAALAVSETAKAAVKTRAIQKQSGRGGGPLAEPLPRAAGTAQQGLEEEKAEETAAPAAAEAAPAPPWELFAPLTSGAVVAYDWRVADLSGPVDGACVLTLQNDHGRVQRVHLCRNDGRPQGLVYTQRLDLVVMNGGRGDLGTEENLAQAVAEVAHVLAANENRRDQRAVIETLLPHAERLERFATANEWTLR
jgi:hypothetical protein